VADLLFIGVIVVFFALMVAFVHWCERIVGRDDGRETTGGPARSDTVSPEEVPA